MRIRVEIVAVAAGLLGALVLALVGVSFLSASGASASGLSSSNAGGDIMSAQFVDGHVFDAKRSPAFPVAGSPFTLFDLQDPFRADRLTSYTLDDGKFVRLFFVGGVCQDGRVGIDLYDSSGAFLERVHPDGQIYGLGPEGFLHDSGFDVGTFFSTDPLVQGGSFTYTPATGPAPETCATLLSHIPLNTAQFVDGQVFDGQRSPAFPVAGSPFTVFGLQDPFRPDGVPYTLDDGKYVRLFFVGGVCQDGRVGIDLYDSSGAFLERVHPDGQIYGLGPEGFLHDSGSFPNIGTFFSTDPLVQGGSITYTPATGPAPETCAALLPNAAACAGKIATIDMNVNGGVGVGTVGADVILGTPAADLIDGLEGDDTICGGGGNDTIQGGADADTIFGEDGDDKLFGSQGHDEIHGGDGADTIHGNRGNDVLFGGNGDDRIFGYSQNDTIDGGPGADRLHGNFGDDTINGGGGDDRIFGYGDQDTLNGGPGDDLISGNFGDDVIDGGEDDDVLFGADGDDIVDGGPGDDEVNGNSLNDTISGGPGNDILDGGIDFDICNGNSGIDTATRCESITGVP